MKKRRLNKVLKLTISILVILLILSLIYLYLIQPIVKTNKLTQPSDYTSKPVVMIIIDSIMDEPLQNTIKEGKAPALEFLMNNGNYYPDMVSSYPTMSVTIDSTLLTGTYPNEHKIPGLVWYDAQNKQFISYGSARQEIMKIGMKHVFHNSLFRLNQNHLSKDVTTIHEELDGQSASINTLVFRGNHEQLLNVPRILNMNGFLEKGDSINGPRYFSYGLLSRLNPNNNKTHFWQAFGFNNEFSTKELKFLIEEDYLPSFSLVYFSDNDKLVHKNGVKERKGIEESDKQLQEILNTYPSWEEAIQDNIWIVMGDSGQSDIGEDKEQALIDLRKLLKEYNVHQISDPIQEQDEIVLGLNERMSFIYLLDNKLEQKHIARQLKNDDRINFIAWKHGDMIQVISGDEEGTLSFKPNGTYTDSYGQKWELEGNEKILDLSITKDNKISYRDFPDGLARLNSSFYSQTGRYLIADAKPGFEFVGEGSPTHVNGASHGSLYKHDSYFPMIVTGTEMEPEHKRMVDLKEWILRILNDEN
ncbi:Predicted pyrophosphatase or phosphodiesterase, AlkP superfamily [Gracilibacillus orientalis]|uniref:Predicted pyrophosphatase or phosphodiesterase, AlkP superfamily n=1 Tax=Gracilibacillus orientalis TaxID=334253 RepID=A0A1I4L4A9_9BACI|nr:alkaline phosphatase family protein [Gracilibacillus orientalis]SFL85804.1 Predicted pyrophosphatase or phosphodiesterase, AlkP superfamily [Gracilibacillus orientalis]